VLIDTVLEQTSDRIVAVKHVSLAEEYLADHFPGFPVLPGVMMVESMVQAARRLLESRSDHRLVLGEVKAIKFGNMVRPGEQLVVEVSISSANDEEGRFLCKGVGRVMSAESSSSPDPDAPTAVSGRFVMRPASPPSAGIGAPASTTREARGGS